MCSELWGKCSIMIDLILQEIKKRDKIKSWTMRLLLFLPIEGVFATYIDKKINVKASYVK